MKFTPPTTITLTDPALDAVVRNINQRIGELQAIALLGTRIVRNVQLPDNVGVTIAHGLGQVPRYVDVSAIRGVGFTAGVIKDLGFTDDAGLPIDRAKVVVLRAVSYTTTITVDVMVVP